MIRRVQKDERLTAETINAVIDQVNALEKISGAGLNVTVTDGGVTLSRQAKVLLATEPALAVRVVNVDETEIPALAPAGIERQFMRDEPDLLTERVLEVRVPTAAHAGRFVIAARAIPPGREGTAWLGGVCLARLVRWFPAAVLDHADVLFDSGSPAGIGAPYLLATAGSGAEILWEADHIGSAEHLAVIRLQPRRQQLGWRNTGAAAVTLGGAVIPNASQDADGLDGGLGGQGALSGKTPDSDTGDLSYVNLGGDVLPDADGACAPGIALARVDQPVNVGDDAGPRDGETAFVKDEAGYKVMAYLGVRQGSHYAVLRPFRPCLIVFTHRNMISETDPDQVFADNGTLEISVADTKKVLLKFRRPIRNPKLGIVQFLSVPFASLTVDEFEGLASYTLTTRAEFVSEDFDPDLVTWNLQPAVLGGDSLDSHFETDTPGTALESLDTQDLTLKSFLSHLAISPNTSGVLFYGLLISLDVAAAHATGDYDLSQPMRADGEVNFANSFIAG